MTLTQKTITGIIWNFTEQIGKRGIGIAITLLLARFLTPADYGLVGMMAVFLAVATSLMDSGFKQALIRLQGATQTDFNTAFYTNLALGALSYALLFVAAPFIAGFYTEARLILLIRVAGLSILINAFQVVQSANLSRELNFKAQLQATIPSGIISGLTAVGLAYTGFGVWALIAQMLVAALLTTILLWRIQSWRPTLNFSRNSLSKMYSFGYKLFLSGLLETVFQNLYVIIIAKIFSAPVAGFYFFATKLKELVISQMVSTIQTVTYPALASLQNDGSRLKNGFRRVIGVTTFLLFPAMLLLAALAEPLFDLVLPEKWLPAAPFLQLMCIAGIMYPLHSVNLNILRIKGRSDLVLFLQIFKKSIAIIILFISYKFGVRGILIGQIISSVLAYVPNSYFSAKLINYTVREQMTDFMPGLILSSVLAVGAYLTVWLIEWPALIELAVIGSLATAFYLLGAYKFKMQAFAVLSEFVKAKRPKKPPRNFDPLISR